MADIVVSVAQGQRIPAVAVHHTDPVRRGVNHPWMSFDRKYVIQPPLEHAHAHPLALVDPIWALP